MKDGSNKYILDSLKLPIMESIEDFAYQTSLSEKLLYFLSTEATTDKYETFFIKKKSGSLREINAPIYSLKIIQRWILENILYRMKVSDNCYGFEKTKKGSPTVANVKQHNNNTYIFKMDVKDFFPSVKRERIFYLFKAVGYNNYISNVLSNFCTYNEHLPQGAVTSPRLANLVCYKLDNRIEKYCTKREIVYTRYADDLTFSSNNRNILRNIHGMISKILMDEGFTPNEDKTNFMTPKSHKSITGITVNDRLIKAPKQSKKLVRAMIHHAVVSGNYSNSNKIRGYISYINSIEPGYKDKMLCYINGFKDDSITLFGDAVAAFNSHKIYKDIDDLTEHKATDFVKYTEADEYVDMMYREREEFLIKHEYIEAEDSTLCDADITVISDDSELPF
ncbi:hypothetical protein SDC9_66749 [bioreactor metagenome]|uniref:Reverse transcriptase domain-containing protein n=1 Tax=bioreactor metagenome TaxID=1076179 RepID=A0A644XVT8_9ZZZZ